MEKSLNTYIQKCTLMNYKLILLIVIFGAFHSCKKDKPELSIKEETLIKMSYDLHTAKYIISRTKDENKDSLTDVYIKQICKIHNVDIYDFLNDIEKMENNPKYFKKFYGKLEVYSDSIQKKFNTK